MKKIILGLAILASLILTTDASAFGGSSRSRTVIRQPARATVVQIQTGAFVAAPFVQQIVATPQFQTVVTPQFQTVINPGFQTIVSTPFSQTIVQRNGFLNRNVQTIRVR